LTAVTTAENSEVFPAESVAVAAITSPATVAAGSGTSKLALPLPSVVRVREPR
jgi:hypothetical protein